MKGLIEIYIIGASEPSWLVNSPKKDFLVTFCVDVNINNDKVSGMHEIMLTTFDGIIA